MNNQADMKKLVRQVQKLQRKGKSRRRMMKATGATKQEVKRAMRRAERRQG